MRSKFSPRECGQGAVRAEHSGHRLGSAPRHLGDAELPLDLPSLLQGGSQTGKVKHWLWTRV